jgi:hypothetical protein
LWDAVDVLALDREKHTSPDAVDGYQQSAHEDRQRLRDLNERAALGETAQRSERFAANK